MITVLNKGETWHDPGCQAYGEIAAVYLDVVGGSLANPQYIANMVVFGKLKHDGKTRKVTNAVRLYGGPLRTYMGCHTPGEIMNWLDAMNADYSALQDVMRRAGWLR